MRLNMTRRRKPSPPDIKEEIATSSYETPPVKKNKTEKIDEFIDLTNDDEFVDSSKDLKLSKLDFAPAEKFQHPYSSTSAKPKPKPEFIRPELRLPTISKPPARGSVASTTSKTSSDSYESYTYGKKRGRGFILAEEDSEEESSASDEEK